MIQMMENPLLSLRSFIDTWLSSIFTPCVTDAIFTFLCGVGLFLLSLTFFKSKPFLPPPKKRNIKKVRNPWTRPNSDYIFLIPISIFSKSPRETPEMGILRKEENIILLE